MPEPIRVDRSPVHGRGVFATRSIAEGELICANELFRVPADERQFLDRTSLYDHYFEYEDDAYIALGPVSFLNHEDNPNADFELDTEHLTIELTARRQIAENEEVSIHYGVEPWW